MIIQCPHCHRNVSPRKCGSCPACRGNTEKPANTSRQLVEIAENATLPEICYVCGEPTRRLVQVKRSRANGRDLGGSETAQSPSFIFVTSLLFGRLLGLLFRLALSTGNEKTQQLTVKVPIRQCKPCSAKLAINPHFVDYDVARMRFLVHKKFERAMS